MRSDSVNSGITDVAPTTPNKWPGPRPPSRKSQAGLTPPTTSVLCGATTTATKDVGLLHDSATATTKNTALPIATRPKRHAALQDVTPGNSSGGDGSSSGWVSHVVLIGGEEVPTALAPTKNKPLRGPSGGGGGVEDQGIGAPNGFGSLWRRTPRPPSGRIPEDWVIEDDTPQPEARSVGASILLVADGRGGGAARETHRAAETGVHFSGMTKATAVVRDVNGGGTAIKDSGIAHNNNSSSSSSSSPASSNGYSFFHREDEEAVEGTMEEERRGPDLALSSETGNGALASDRLSRGRRGGYPVVDTGLDGEGLGNCAGFTPSTYGDDDGIGGISRGFSDRRVGIASRTATKAARSAVDVEFTLETSGERTKAAAAAAVAAATASASATADVALSNVNDDDDLDDDLPPQLPSIRIDASDDPGDGGGPPPSEDLPGMV